MDAVDRFTLALLSQAISSRSFLQRGIRLAEYPTRSSWASRFSFAEQPLPSGSDHNCPLGSVASGRLRSDRRAAVFRTELSRLRAVNRSKVDRVLLESSLVTCSAVVAITQPSDVTSRTPFAAISVNVPRRTNNGRPNAASPEWPR